MVFDAAAAPRSRAAFIAWYDQNAHSTEPSSDDLSMLTAELKAWFMEMIEDFPPMNGPLACLDVDDPSVTDYGLSPSSIYAMFSWSQAEAAYHRTIELAAKHRVGFFDVSAPHGDIWTPTSDGKLEKLAN